MKWNLMGLFLLVTVICLGQAGSVQARGYYVTPFAGYSLFEGGSPLDDAPLYGLSLGGSLAGGWGLEGTFAYLPTDSEAGPSTDVDLFQAHVNLLYRFRAGQDLTPYLLAGAGLWYADADRGGSDEDLLLTWGVGIEAAMSPSLALRTEVRHVIFNNLPKGRGEGTVHNVTGLVGLALRLGAESGDSARSAAHGAAEEPLVLPEPLDDMELQAVAVSMREPRDGDADGIVDERDLCPDTPRDAVVNQDGCAAGDVPVLTLSPRFLQDTAEIELWPEEELSRLREFLREYSGRRVTVGCISREAVPSYRSFRVSQARAERVRLFLLENFDLRPGRVRAEGYGRAHAAAARRLFDNDYPYPQALILVDSPGDLSSLEAGFRKN